MPNDALLSGNNDDFSKELAAMVDARALEDIKKMVLVFCNAKNDIVSTIAHFSEPVRKKSGIDADLEALSSDLETINKRLIDGRITHAQTWNQLKIYLLRIKQLLNRCSDTLESLHEKPSRIRSTLFEDPSKKVQQPIRNLLLDQLKETEPLSKSHQSTSHSRLPRLQKTSGVQQDRHDFAHIHGDYFIQETKLEGNQALKMATVFQQYLKWASKIAETTPEATKAFEQLLELVNLGMKFEQHIDKINDIHQFTEAFKDLVETLSSGKETLFFGGWTAPPGKPGHAVYFKLKKQNDGGYSVKIYNTGGGLNEYHPAAMFHGYEERYQTFLEKKNVSKTRLLSVFFLKPLMELRQPPPDTNTNSHRSTDYSASDLYDSLFFGLDGTLETEAHDQSRFIIPQHSGVCSWAGLMALARDFLEPNDYDLFVQRVKLQSLIDFYQDNKKRMEKDDQLRLLLRHSVQQLSRETKANRLNGLFHEDEYATIAATVIAIGDEIEGVFKTIANQAFAEAPVIDFKSSAIRPFQSNAPISSLSTITTRDEDLSTEPALISTYNYPLVNGIHHPKEMIDCLKEADAFCVACYQQRDYRALGAFIPKVLEALPTPKMHEEDIWGQLNEDSRHACRKILLSLGEKLLFARQNLPENRHQRLEDTINAHKAFLIQHRIAVINNDPPGIAEWPMPPMNEFERCFEFSAGKKNHHPVFGDTNIYDEKYRKLLAEMVAYGTQHREKTGNPICPKFSLNSNCLFSSVKS